MRMSKIQNPIRLLDRVAKSTLCEVSRSKMVSCYLSTMLELVGCIGCTMQRLE